MDIGTMILWSSLFVAVTSVAFTILFILNNNFMFKFIASITAITLALLVTSAYILLTFYFTTSNFDIHYVWDNSGEGLEWYLKVSGVWAGQEGSLLLWVWIILIPLGVIETNEFLKFRRLTGKSQENKTEINIKNSTMLEWTRIIVLLVAILFLALLVLKDPFEPTHIAKITTSSGSTITLDPDDFPAGHGLNPMLRNWWMVIHPPLLFIGYGLITIPFAASLSYSLTGDKKWTRISLQWSRLAWLFLTLGIGIGAVWAYVAIGWGGYWYWDAVEVGSLIPWITLTAFMHVQLRNKNNNEYEFLTPVLGTITFALVIFATFITRSGLWMSVHAWAETEVGQILLASIIITLIASAIIIIRAIIIKRERTLRGEDEFIYFPKSWDSRLMFITTLIFMVLSFLTFYVLMRTMKVPAPTFYETMLAPAVLALVFALSVCLGWRLFRKENLMHLLMWTTIAGIACAIFLPRYVFPGNSETFYLDNITTHHVVGFTVPFIAVGIIATVYKIISLLKLRSVGQLLKRISPHVIHLGVLFIIISYGASQTMVTEKIQRLRVDESLDIGGYQIILKSIKVIEDTGDIDSNEYWDTWNVNVEVYENKKMLTSGIMNVVYSYRYDEQGNRYYSRIMSSEVYVDGMVFEDLFISFKGLTDDEVEITAKIIPMIPTLWGGMGLFVAGIAVRTAAELIPSKARTGYEHTKITRDRVRTESVGIGRRVIPSSVSTRGTVKSTEYYEKLIEDELEKL